MKAEPQSGNALDTDTPTASRAVRKISEPAVRVAVVIVFLFELLVAFRRRRRKGQFRIIQTRNLGIRRTDRILRLVGEIAERSFFLLLAAATAVVMSYALWGFQLSNEVDGMAGVWYQISMVPFTIAILRYAADVDRGAGGAPDENEGRRLLQKGGLITLKDPANPLSTLNDIVSNPKGLKFRELEAATLPRVLGELDLAVINTNYVLDAKLSPTKDALLLEDSRSPYVNFLVARPDNKDDPRVQKRAAAASSPISRSRRACTSA